MTRRPALVAVVGSLLALVLSHVVGAPVARAAGDDIEWDWQGSGAVRTPPTAGAFVGPCFMGVQREVQPIGVALGGRGGGLIGARTTLVLQGEVCVGLNPIVLTATPAVRHFIN